LQSLGYGSGKNFKVLWSRKKCFLALTIKAKVLDYGIIGKKYRFSFKFLAWITVVGKISELRITVLGKKIDLPSRFTFSL